MKNLKPWKKAGLISIIAVALLAGPMPGIKAKHDSKPAEIILSMPSAQSAEPSIPLQETKNVDKKDLEHITMYCLVKGTPHEAIPMKYLEIRSKTDKGERKLYFEVYYSNSGDSISANKIRFVESEYKTEKGGTDIPHNYIGDYGFEQNKNKDRYIISQKMIADGGEYGMLDGNADIMMERKVIETTDKVVLNADQDTEVKDKEKVKKAYKDYVKEIIEITGKEEIKEDKPKAAYEVSI